jgi:hypothetical protein
VLLSCCGCYVLHLQSSLSKPEPPRQSLRLQQATIKHTSLKHYSAFAVAVMQCSAQSDLIREQPVTQSQASTADQEKKKKKKR